MDDRLELELNGVRISCAVDGSPGAPPLVLVHGGNSDASTWDGVAACFSDEYRIYAPELRGHGRSQWAKTYSYELFGDDLVRLGEALELEQATVVGHSLGGLAALLAAQQRPTWLRRLVIEDTMLRRDPVQLPPPGPAPADATCDWVRIVSALRPQVEDPPASWWANLPHIEVPTLLLLGDTRKPPQQLAVDALRIIPDSRLRVLGTGHFVHSDNPLEYVAELRNFFAAHPLGNAAFE